MRRRILLALLLVVVAGAAFVGTGVVIRLTAPPPAPRVTLSVPGTLAVVPGPRPRLPLPAAGAVAMTSSVDGELAAVNPDTRYPIASIAKTMTALLVLEAHPLPANGDGPVYTITPADVALYHQTVAEDGSFLPVTAGERFTERQMLLGMMLPSANNLAETFAVWVAGSRDAFIAKLNDRAASLGMTATHFADPSGFNPDTVSTAHDLVKLGEAALADSALASIVATKQATMPDGTVVHNLDSNLETQPGWLGLKTGSGGPTGGNLLFAAQRHVGDGPPIRVVGAILHQSTLDAALQGAAAVAETALRAYVAVRPSSLQPAVSGRIDTEWGDSGDVMLVPQPLGGPDRADAVYPGTLMTLTSSTVPPSVPLSRGTVVGSVAGRTPAGLEAVWSVQSASAVSGPSWTWRLEHG